MSRTQYEKDLREKHPSLKEAWEQYQILLKMYESAEPYNPRDYRLSTEDMLNEISRHIRSRR